MGFTAMLLFDASSGVWSDSVENCPFFSQKATIYIHLYHHVEMINAKSQICFVSRCVFSPSSTSHIHPIPHPPSSKAAWEAASPRPSAARPGSSAPPVGSCHPPRPRRFAAAASVPRPGSQWAKAKACYISLGYGSSTWFIYIYNIYR